MDSKETKVILGQLCALAPSTEVRNCLRLYGIKSSYNQLQKNFSSCKVGQLLLTLTYLKVQSRINLEDLTKDGLIHKLILRIHNLMLETCEFCNETYAQTIDSPSLLPCELCGQDVHPECLASKLGLDIANTPVEDIRKAVNPFDIHGWTYLCKICKDDSIPTDDDYLKKSVLKAAKKAQISTTAQASNSVSSSVLATTSTEATSTGTSHPRPDTSIVSQSPSQAEIDAVPQSPPPAEMDAEIVAVSHASTSQETQETVDSVQVRSTQSNSSQIQISVLPPSDPKYFPNLCPDYLVFKAQVKIWMPL